MCIHKWYSQERPKRHVWVEVGQPRHKLSSIKENAGWADGAAKSKDRTRGQSILIRSAELPDETRQLA
jgi:hypothetical protein